MGPKNLLVVLSAAVALPAAAGSVVIPTDVQLRWADYEVGAIGHFLPISNQHGCRDATAFDPHNLDTDAWVRAIAKFGAKYAVFVVRHACGFCLWPTNATVAETGFAYEHSIKYSPLSGRDLAAEFVASCHKYGVRPALYAAVANNAYMDVKNNKFNATGKALVQSAGQYYELVTQQLTELWSNYGDLAEVWFDGGIDEKYVVPLAGLFGRLQPDAVAFQMTHTPNGVRWAGTEDGYIHNPRDHKKPPRNPAYWPSFSTAASAMDFGSGEAGAPVFAPPVCDVTLQLADNWWYWPGPHGNGTGRLRSLHDLKGIYHGSVGRNCGLELDWSPMDDGSMNPDDAAAYAAFGKWIQSCYGRPVASAAGPAGSANVTLSIPAGATIDRMGIMEDQTQGERITGWRIRANRAVVLSGTSVGHKIIQILPNATTLTGPATLAFEVIASLAPPRVRGFAAFDGANC